MTVIPKGLIDPKSYYQGYEDGKCYRENQVTDRELIIFLMDEIDTASQWLVEGQTHMATGVLGQCHAEIRKHLSK